MANFIDDTLDSLMQQGRAETDPAKRKAIFAEFEKHLAEMSPWIWLYTSYSYTAQQKNIAGLRADADRHAVQPEQGYHPAVAAAGTSGREDFFA